MKLFLKITAAFALVISFLASCNKVDNLPVFDAGSAPSLTASTATAAPVLADSSKTVISFSWTSPKYATDSSTYKYVLQIDSAGKKFTNPVYTKTVSGTKTIGLKGSEITKLITDAGYGYNTLYSFDVRVKSSYANNNELYTSNIVKVKMSAYVTPPKITLPTTGKLFIVGSATVNGWNTPIPSPSQEFGKIDSVTYVGVFNMSGGNEFLVLPQADNFNNKYALENNSLPGVNAGGDFGLNQGSTFNSNFKGPSNSGWYKVTLDFQRGKYTIVPYVGPQIPSNLFITGNAVPSGWVNPVPDPAQRLVRLNSVQFSLPLIAITGGNEYLLLPVNGDWSNKYSVTNTGTAAPLNDFLGYNNSSNFPAPTISGNYKIEVNFGIQKKDASGEIANTANYKLTKF